MGGREEGGVDRREDNAERDQRSVMGDESASSGTMLRGAGVQEISEH